MVINLIRLLTSSQLLLPAASLQLTVCLVNIKSYFQFVNIIVNSFVEMHS